MAKGDVIRGDRNYYLISYELDTTINIARANKVLSLEPSFDLTVGYFPSGVERATVTITFPDNNTLKLDDKGSSPETVLYVLKLSQLGTYQIKYQGVATATFNNGVGAGSVKNENYSFYYIISVIENHLPLKKWSITDVINRTLALAEPLRKGECPRFKLNGMRADGTIITDDNKHEDEVVGQAARFDKILAPQFSFTKQTLRECLQEIGKVIHGEPRLSIQKDENGYFYEVSYDMYASQEESNLQFFPYTSKSAQHVIENYKEIHQSYSYFCSCLRNNFIPLLRVFTIELSRIKVEYCICAAKKRPFKRNAF